MSELVDVTPMGAAHREYILRPTELEDNYTTSTAQMVDLSEANLDNMYRQLAGALHSVARAQGREIKIVVISRRGRWE